MPINITGPLMGALGAIRAATALHSIAANTKETADLARQDYDWTHSGDERNVDDLQSVVNDKSFNDQEINQMLKEDYTPLEISQAFRLRDTANNAKQATDNLAGFKAAVIEAAKMKGNKAQRKAFKKLANKAGGNK